MPRNLLPPTIEGVQHFELTQNQLKELEGEIGQALSVKDEVQLQSICSNYLVFRKFEEQAELPSAATRIYDDLIGKLDAAISALTEIVENDTNRDILNVLDELLQKSAPDSILQTFERYLEFQQLVTEAGILHSLRNGVNESSWSRGLVSHLSILSTSLSNISSLQTAQHYEVRGELHDRLLRENFTLARVMHDTKNFRRLVANCRTEHRERYGGVGRPMKNEALRDFIWKLANLFEAGGGTAGVTYQPVDDCLQSPFLRWVSKINSFLPPEFQASFTALPDLIREICRLRNKRKKDDSPGA